MQIRCSDPQTWLRSYITAASADLVFPYLLDLFSCRLMPPTCRTLSLTAVTHCKIEIHLHAPWNEKWHFFPVDLRVSHSKKRKKGQKLTNPMPMGLKSRCFSLKTLRKVTCTTSTRGMPFWLASFTKLYCAFTALAQLLCSYNKRCFQSHLFTAVFCRYKQIPILILSSLQKKCNIFPKLHVLSHSGTSEKVQISYTP